MTLCYNRKINRNLYEQAGWEITVIDCHGSGKSTLSRVLHNITGITLFAAVLLLQRKDGR